MRLIIAKDYADVSRKAANIIAAQIYLKPDCVLGLATGSTPEGLYAELVKDCAAGKISFKDVSTYNLDEYRGLENDHPQSYHFFMWDNFFNHINIKKENVHILNGMAKDLAAE